MAISNAARRNHDELFPGHISTLEVTDPELIEYFDNFALDQVLRHGGLDTRTRLTVQLASMIAFQAVGEYRVMLGAALTVGVTPVEAKEIVYQAVPYVGMAKVFDFLHATNDILTARGVELPLDLASRRRRPETRAEKGIAVQKGCWIGDGVRASPGAWRTSGRSAAAPPWDHARPPSAAKQQVTGRGPSSGTHTAGRARTFYNQALTVTPPGHILSITF